MSTVSFEQIRRICVVNFTGERPNWGCQATSWELLKFLNAAFEPAALPAVSLVPLLPRCDVDAEIAERHLGDIHKAIEDCSDGTADATALAFLERICCERYGFWAEMVRSSDLVVFQAEGTMTGTDFVRATRLLLLPFVAKHVWGKPVLSLNQTLFICDPDFNPIAANALGSFDLLAVREPISLDVAKSIGLAQCRHIPDTAFLTRPGHDAALPEFQPDRQYFCVTGTAFRTQEDQERIFEIADAVRAQTGLVPVIAASTKPDRKLEELAHKAWQPGSYEIVPSSLHYPAAAAAMAHCNFLLGGRYHMAVMAAAVGTPALLVRGNTFKNESLAALLDMPRPVRALDDVRGVVQDAASLMSSLTRERQALSAAYRNVAGAIETGRKWVASVIRGQSGDASALQVPPGRPIRARDHMEPYASVAIEQARNLKYLPADPPSQRFGRKIPPARLFEPLLAGLNGDHERSWAVIQQLIRSDPSVLSECSDRLKRRLTPESVQSTPSPAVNPAARLPSP